MAEIKGRITPLAIFVALRTYGVSVTQSDVRDWNVPRLKDGKSITNCGVGLKLKPEKGGRFRAYNLNK
ncbi:MAG: hypothetical protein JRJ06_06920 [Deltaproteobacteria bacterium]|nr:hypothetical protein [Deltaproteobacteria bacterium]